MQIKTMAEARNWARKVLRFDFVLVDGTGNIYCCTDAQHMAAVADEKSKAGIAVFIVKGLVPAKPAS